jgi:hypothetical protein
MYDSIKDKLLSAMQELGIPVKLINLTRATLKKGEMQNQTTGSLFRTISHTKVANKTRGCTGMSPL